jgi:hypothetical protein
MKIRFFLVTLAVMMLLSSTAYPMDIKKASRDDLKKAFDVCVQNYGALEYSYYTFTLEFERAPDNYEEMVKTGHIRVKMMDPYTGKEVKVINNISKAKAGNLYYKKLKKSLAEFSCFYVNPNDASKTRNMNSTIVTFTHKELQKVVFGDNASREEKLTRVYLLQLDDAIESFEQKLGHMPDSLDDLAKRGDVNVGYINPFTGKLAKQSETLSPGDYFYRKFTKKVMHKEPERKPNGEVVAKDVASNEEFYEVIGWGKTEPVYYYSNDRDKEELKWDEKSVRKNIREFLEDTKRK